MICILPASSAVVAERAALVNAAYAGYYVPLQLAPDQVQAMDDLYDVALELSVVARSEEDLVGMALLSQRAERGWVSAVGVVPEHRREGIARRMMSAVLSNAGFAGVRTITLEAISQNEPARNLYRSLGFVETRELLSWRFPADADPLPIPEERLVAVPCEALMDRFDAWHVEPPCWQREAATLRKMAARANGYALELDGAPCAYCIVSERGETLSILDVGIDPSVGAVNAGRLLLQALAAGRCGRALTIVNVPADDGLCRALAALHFTVVVRQIEMSLAVNGR